MDIQVDQSGKIEETSRSTTLALSNGHKFTVTISGKVKRWLQQDFRQRGEPRLFMLRTFAACLTLLIWHARFKNLPTVIVDEEYPGNDIQLGNMVKQMWATQKQGEPLLVFRRVGKGSPAHDLANKVATGRRPADRVLSYEEVRRLALNKVRP